MTAARLPVLAVLRAQRAGALAGLPAPARLVLVALADFATTDRPPWAPPDGGDAWAWPSLAELVRVTGCSQSTVQRAIRQLFDAGLVVPVGRKARNAHGYVVNLTSLVTPNVVTLTSLDGVGGVKVVNLTIESGQPDQSRVVNLTTDSPRRFSQGITQNQIPTGDDDLDPGEAAQAPAPTRTREAPRRWSPLAPIAVPAHDPRTTPHDPSAPGGAPSGAFAPPSGCGSVVVSGAGGTMDPSGERNALLSRPDGRADVAHRPPLRLPSADPRSPTKATPDPTPSAPNPAPAPAGPEVPAPPAFLGALQGIGSGGRDAPLRARPVLGAPEPLPVRPARPPMGESKVGEPAPSPIPSPPPPAAPVEADPVKAIEAVLLAHPYTTSLRLDARWLAEDLRDASRGRELSHVLAALGRGLAEVASLRLIQGPARGKLVAYARNASVSDLPPEARPPKEEPKEELPEGWHFPGAVRAALRRFQLAATNGLCLDPEEVERVFLENNVNGYHVRPVRLRRSEWVPTVIRYLRGQATRCGVFLPADIERGELDGLPPESCMEALPRPPRRAEPRPPAAVERMEAMEIAAASRRLAAHLASVGVPFPGAGAPAEQPEGEGEEHEPVDRTGT